MGDELSGNNKEPQRRLPAGARIDQFLGVLLDA
jgi:hypothetical protein